MMDARTRTQLAAAGIDPAKLPPGTLIGGKPLDQFAAQEKPVRGRMNKTEAAYARHLEYLRLLGFVVAWWFEPFSLKLAPRTHYRPDFLVQYKPRRIELVEIKGEFVREDSAVKFKVSRDKFPCFDWQCLQWKKGEWRSLFE